MDLKLLDQIKTSVARRVPVDTPLVSTAFEVRDDAVIFGWDHAEYRSEIRIGVSQIAPDDAVEEVQRAAVRSITHMIYGPILDELLNVRREMLRAGHRHPALDRVNAMIDQITSLSI